MTDFSDRPLVAGTAVGLRAFDVDRLGRLSGPSFGQVFTPGENVAKCRKKRDPGGWLTFSPGPFTGPVTLANGDVLTVSPSATSTPTPPPKEQEEHRAGRLGCPCGFYAYFDGGNDYKAATRITAIIEGYGCVVMGERGFRAEKARLVALIEPGKRFRDELRPLVHRNYGDVPFYASRTEALEAHPLSSEQIPTPESDPEFWTRDLR